MSKYIFKKGDIIRMKEDCSNAIVGKDYVLVEHDDGYLTTLDDNGDPACSCQYKWELKTPRVEKTMVSFVLSLIK